MRIYSPPMMGSHAIVVALHPEGMGVVIAPCADDETWLELAGNSAILTPTSNRYDVTAPGESTRVVLAACTWQVTHTAECHPVWKVVPTEGDTPEDVTGAGVPEATGEGGEEPGAVPLSVAETGPRRVSGTQGERARCGSPSLGGSC